MTQYASWRACLLVNIGFAAVAVAGTARFRHQRERTDTRVRVDVPGAVTVTAGVVAVVLGFSSAQTAGWGAPVTVIELIAGAVLAVVFVALQTRVTHPVLPLRILEDRTRGGSYLVLALANIGVFGVFLFLTFYLQLTAGYSSLETGIAFLPLPVAITVSAMTGSRLLPRSGPRPLIAMGGLLGAAGLLWLRQIDLQTHYATIVLPGLILMGLGMGQLFSAALNTATAGVLARDAGVASAAVNTMQQVGGSIGTALLSTLAAQAVTNALSAYGDSPLGRATATLSGYHLAFLVASGIFVVIAAIGLIVIEGGPMAVGETAIPS